jgi:hypothetical protein
MNEEQQKQKKAKRLTQHIAVLTLEWQSRNEIKFTPLFVHMSALEEPTWTG